VRSVEPSELEVPGGAPDSVRRSVEQATRLVVGALGAAVDAGARVLVPEADQGSDGENDTTSAGDVVVGAVLAAQDRVLDATERAARLMGRAAPVARRVGRLPLVRPVSEAVSRRVDELAARGATERVEGQAAVSQRVDVVIGQAVSSELLGRTIDEVVAELLPGLLEKALPEVLDQLAADPDLLIPMVQAMLDPLLDAALPEVMGKLNEQPEIVRELVLGQSVSIAGEVASEVRTRGVAADDLAERIARRLTLRRPRPELPTPPRELPRGDNGSGQIHGDNHRT
jgi:hypothetical protein